MPRHPKRTKKEWKAAGFDIAVVVERGIIKAASEGEIDRHKYGAFHKMDAADWDFRTISHIIPVETFAGAMEAHEERDGAAPCRKCFPVGAKKVGGDDGDE